MRFRVLLALTLGASLLMPVTAQAAPTLQEIQAKVLQLEEEATTAAEGAQEAKVKLAGLTRKLRTKAR